MGICQCSWWGNNSFQIYLSHILSSWSDRMWSFAIGLYFVILYPHSLQVTAIYGFSICVSVILFAPLIGKWIDKSRRISAAQLALVIQNSSVIICCGLLISILHYSEELKSQTLLKNLGIGCIILIANIANLASEATKIALEKDWIVVLADGDERRLSKMNSTMRSIDLTTFILAPIIVGQILTYGSKISGAIFIASWNLVSGFFEYALLRLIYQRVPLLAYKNIPAITIASPTPPNSKAKPVELSSGTISKQDVTNANLESSSMKTPRGENEIAYDHLSEINLITPSPSNINLKISNLKSNKIHPETCTYEKSKMSSNFVSKVLNTFKQRATDTIGGWKDYFNHPVRFAGIGLALLYMTVLGFDHITVGFAYSQGISESLVSIMTAIGALFGILGSLAFPHLRNKFGKYATGNIGFGLETLCLVSCLVSVFAPGSPFVHKDAFKSQAAAFLSNSTTSTTYNPVERTTISVQELFSSSRLSILLLMAGIIFARFGLWVADLTVLQFFQERIPEDKRGILNGVQGALNQFMNLVKFVLVMILPQPERFGYLIFVSWVFVFMGWISFMLFTCLYARRKGTKDKEQEFEDTSGPF